MIWHRFLRVSAAILTEEWPINSIWESPEPYPLGHPLAHRSSFRASGSFSVNSTNTVPISLRRRLSPYSPVKQCIYCGATSYDPKLDQVLGTEHIIPKSLGGTLELPASSCRSCEIKINRFETRIAGDLLWAVRDHLGISDASPEKLEKRLYPLRSPKHSDNTKLQLTLDDYPSILHLFKLNPPGTLVERPRMVPGAMGHWTKNLNYSFSRLKELKITAYATPSLDTVLFCQLLAKIGHAFATAEIGHGKFKPYLPRLILENHARKGIAWQKRYHLVGGEPFCEPESSKLHELSVGISKANEKNYVVVRIRLFANEGAPTYYVVVGHQS